MKTVEVRVPDIGDFRDVEVIELMVAAGEKIARDQSLVLVESDKASMEIPSPQAGIVREMKVRLGDRISEGSLLLLLDVEDDGEAAADVGDVPDNGKKAGMEMQWREDAVSVVSPLSQDNGLRHAVDDTKAARAQGALPHASPSVRKYARELGVDLRHVRGTGPKERIMKTDVQGYVRALLNREGSPNRFDNVMNLPPWPSLDFSQYGETELQPLSRIKKISGPNLHRNWVMIPHVTQYEQADVTELEAFRKSVNGRYRQEDIQLTVLAFVVKACVAALKKYPEFNASLDATGENLILKRYYHIGFATDTAQGLVVPVIRDADRKGVIQIAREMTQLSSLAREGKLNPSDMQGASFTITSLGSIGGTYFTPLINAPEVAIVGLSRITTQPVWDGEQFRPRLILPLSLSYDHRVIDGVQGVRFATYLAKVLSDMKETLL
ncbi:dihydrolipoyllysine-residue acetyltransferase [Oxalobacter sp. OxGP1]|uniref:dihydrolipoyllysine-residue acetyltransferase n=1 Tax=Oxalobacter paeniformigenes TaxID=2946594 RepID=UPI0022B061CB|nr:dihydrolipoyllysine-residue acetyltransferase [Oxalobacter paeniformigenes]MCZ4053004.1 dihydrolipoyllysine-residue acetyltransferase [Oxalobacter paeniformigenes]